MIPAAAGRAPTDADVTGLDVVMVDISFKRDDLLAIAAKAKSVLILDHHKSAADDLSGEFPANVKCVCDMKRCASEIAWDYWFSPETRPWFIEVIADRDLWRWTNPSSKAIGNYLFNRGFYDSHMRFGELFFWKQRDVDNAADAGQTMLEVEERALAFQTKNARLCEFKTPSRTYKVYLLGTGHGNASEIGARLSARPECDFAVLWRYSFENDEWWLSCRSSKERPDIDLSKITAEFGGGGHAQAAGMVLRGTPEKPPRLQDHFKMLPVGDLSKSTPDFVASTQPSLSFLKVTSIDYLPA
jgi:oligoribonuclease NrnB/cAMP/cGMP phosphodiesterase (DHH superfamily)